MPPQDWTKVISTSVVPVAIISACALLCLALYNRLASMVSRLRGFQRERLREYQEYAEHVRTGEEDASSRELHQRVMKMLEVQTRRVYRRARMMRFSIMLLLSAVAALTLCSLTTGMALLVPAMTGAARLLAEALFMGGMVLMFLGVLLAILELWGSLEPVQLESQFVGELARELDSKLLKHDSSRPGRIHDEVADRD